MPFFFHLPPVPPVPGTGLPPMISMEAYFSDEEVDRINALADALEASPVTVGAVPKVNREFNRSVRRHLPPTRDFLWVYQKLADATAHINSQVFKFDLTGFDEMLYHVTYFGDDRGHYDWHIDGQTPEKPMRKLSLTVQMSAGDDYEGGELEVNRAGDPVVAPKRKGSVVSFPSFHLHRVRPVTKGVRAALVAWVVGPPLR